MQASRRSPAPGIQRGAMVARRAARGRAATGASHARLTPFQRSMIYMGSIASMTMLDIVGKVQKSDGSSLRSELHGGTLTGCRRPLKDSARPVRFKSLHCALIPLPSPSCSPPPGSPMQFRGLLRPTGVQAVSLGLFALHFDWDWCHQGQSRCKFTATTAPKAIPNDFSRGKCARSCPSSCCGSKREKMFLF